MQTSAGIAAFGFAKRAAAQTHNLLASTWTAKWIGVPGAPPYDYGVYHFRKTIELPAKPARFIVHASGDNRYQLFVNGRRVAWGPARGDLFHWQYETVDLAPYLEAGKNVLSAIVWNMGEWAPEAQITLRSGFVLQGGSKAEEIADTNATWKCDRSGAYSPLPVTHGEMRGYFVAGPGDRVDASQYAWNWSEQSFDDASWKNAVVVAPAAGRDATDVHSRWMLVPRTIPMMEETPERLRAVRKAIGIAAPKQFPAVAEPVTVPPHTKAALLLDQTYLTTGYPEIVVSGGKQAVVTLRYAESLVKVNGRAFDKGDRNEVEGKEFIGYRDVFVADGGTRRTFRPLWWRTWRYVELSVETQDDPLTIDDLRGTFTAYPFERKAKLEAAGAPEVAKILDVGWRTARLCAHETYMDCPYYEQLQYGGDTRVQSLLSVFNSGDTRLMRTGIDLINDSRQSDGCTMSRYPTRLQQYIPAWTLWWVGMVHDYWWYADDVPFLKQMLPGVRAVLSFFEARQKQNGSLGPLPWWRNFDWVEGWRNGDAPQESDGSSAPFDLLLLLAYRWAADLEQAVGLAPLSEVYRTRERQLRKTAQDLYWDAGRQLYADTPKKDKFSHHSNTLAVLGDVITGDAAGKLMLKTLSEPGLAQSALFFRFYVHLALRKAGEGDRYLDQLGDWRDMLNRNLTTFAETADRPGRSSRSDCHAWSASPNIEMFRTVLGVDSAAPAFSKVRVEPHLGSLTRVTGSVPHPKGAIEVALGTQRRNPRGADLFTARSDRRVRVAAARSPAVEERT
jgi:hypothetical protein